MLDLSASILQIDSSGSVSIQNSLFFLFNLNPNIFLSGQEFVQKWQHHRLLVGCLEYMGWWVMILGLPQNRNHPILKRSVSYFIIIDINVNIIINLSSNKLH